MFKTQYILTLDTETASLTGDVYDVAFAIHNRKGEIVESFSAVVREIATNPEAMMQAFYAKKMFSHYIPALSAQSIPLLPWAAIVEALREMILRYDARVISAYNLNFDARVMKATHRQLGHKGAILPHSMKMLDIWEFACRSRLNKKKYKELAKREGWVSAAGNIKTTAECAYRFVSGNLDFVESHTALEDVKIEAQILADCFRAKTVVPYNILTGQPWRIVNS